MSFESAAKERLARYRREAGETLRLTGEIEDAARRFFERLSEGLERTASLANGAGFEVEVEKGEGTFSLRLEAGERAVSEVRFALLEGAAAETDVDLMHEKLSRHTLQPSGYSARILGWTPPVSEPCQTFAVYRDGLWRTKGSLVEKSRGKVEGSEEVVNGFCLRIVGRLVDLAAPTSGSGKVWRTGGYSLAEFTAGKKPPVETRWLK